MNRGPATVMLHVLCWFCLTSSALAATDVVEVYFLSVQEAADVVRSQLSGNGKVAVIPSRRMLLIDDDAMHIQKAKAWLKRLDHPPGQYTAYVNIQSVIGATNDIAHASGYVVLGKLAGGWLEVKLGHQQYGSGQQQSFQLRVSGDHPAHIEAGTIRLYRRETVRWLSGYGIARINSVEPVAVTSGFNITVIPAGSDKVRVHIVPWMQRFSDRSRSQHGRQIEIAGAATELVMPVDESVTIAAASQEAAKLGAALLSDYADTERHHFVMHLRVNKSM